MSAYQSHEYEFDYILTAAMRWGNRQIDDFTLNVDMGNEQVFHIDKTFFRKNSDWKIIGTGRMESMIISKYDTVDEDGNPITEDEQGKATRFYIKNGYIQFKKENFKTDEDFYLESFGYPPYPFDFDYAEDEYLYPDLARYELTEEVIYESHINKLDPISKFILHHMPYARRGYIFSDPVIQKFHESQIWYMPDSSYKKNFNGLSKNEQDWILFFEKEAK